MNARTAIADAAPRSIEAEQALLGAMMLNNEAYGLVAGILSPEDFSETSHQAIYAECARQITAGKTISPITLKAALPDATVAGLPIFQYLVNLSRDATTLLNLRDFAQTIRDLAIMREIMLVGQDVAGARNSLQAPDVALREAWDKLDSLRAGGPQEGANSTIGAISDRLVQETEEKRAGKPDTVPSTGLTDFDKMIGGGYRAGRLIVLAGRPGMGKTVIAVESARRVGHAGFGVGIFSLEIDDRELSARMLASEMARSHAPLDYRDILSGNLEGLAPVKVKEAADRLRNLPIQIDTTGGKRSGGPRLSDLRDSGNIEEHADVVGLLYRPHYYDQRDTKIRNGDAAALEAMNARRHDLDLLLEKNRLGPTMAVRLWCDVGKSSVDNAQMRYR